MQCTAPRGDKSLWLTIVLPFLCRASGGAASWSRWIAVGLICDAVLYGVTIVAKSPLDERTSTGRKSMRGMTIGCLVLACTAVTRVYAQSPIERRTEFGAEGAVMAAVPDAGPVKRYGALTVRIGHRIGATRFLVEARLTANERWSAADPGTSVASGLNLLYSLGSHAAQFHHSDTYVSGGTAFAFRHNSADNNGAQHLVAFSAGLGRRFVWRAAAVRPELSVTRTLQVGTEGEPGFASAATRVGVRIGMSFWQ